MTATESKPEYVTLTLTTPTAVATRRAVKNFANDTDRQVGEAVEFLIHRGLEVEAKSKRTSQVKSRNN